MAKYDYRCDTCKTEVEISKLMAEYERPEFCSTCKSEMKRLISKTSFTLKGTGWARDNYSNKPKVTFKMKDGTSETVNYNPKLDKGSK